MATVIASPSEIENFRVSATQVLWEALANGDVGSSVELHNGSVTFQVFGTFGSGGTCVLQGSNDNSNWATLSDPQGNAISKTAAALEEVEEHPRYIRPYISAGDGTTDLDVYVIIRRIQ